VAGVFDRAEERERMVREQLAGFGIRDPRVLAAMWAVPRHEFVPEELRPFAYEDAPLAIGYGQTISQPYIVALMCELAALEPGARVLEVGTGCGYQAAVLAELAGAVYTIEIVESLAREARTTLERLGYERVHTRHGDGTAGWPDAAPFDAILLAAAPEHVPPALLDQLAMGGRLVAPIGIAAQEIQVHRRTADGIEMRRGPRVAFVPMTGAAERR
jgi:protein-L-isoaspartate(D-aspartate) O-methyltransferase